MDLAWLMISTPNTLNGLRVKLLNQQEEELYNQLLDTNAHVYRIKFGALISGEKMAQFYAQAESGTNAISGFTIVDIDVGDLYASSSRKTFAERHYSRNPDNKYDCTTETFINSCREGYGNCNRNSDKFQTGNICRDLI